MKNIEAYNFSQIKGVDQKIIEKLKGLLLRSNKVLNERPNGSKAVGIMEHSTDRNVKPIKHYGSPVVHEKLLKHIKNMLKLGVIEPSQSPWSSPCLLVKKKDGTERFVTVFRQYTKGDVFPVPRIDMIFDKFAGCKYFSTIDLKHAF